MKKDTSRSTILVITTGFLILYLVFSWQWAIFVSLAVGLAGILSEKLSRIIEKAWMKFAQILSFIVPSILLGIVFYFILFPVALVSKLFIHDPLKLSNKYKSCFNDIDKELDKKSFEKIW